MNSSFIPSNSEVTPADTTIDNDGFYPDLSVNDFSTTLSVSGLSEEVKTTHLQSAMLEVNAILETWQALQTEYTLLGDVPGKTYGTITDKEIHYKAAVYYMAKALIFATSRDYDSTKAGQMKSDLQEESTDDFRQQSQMHISRLQGRSRVQVELI